MSYASNCPISKPVKVYNRDIHADLSGVQWSNDQGYMYDVQDEMLPFEPSPPGANG